MAHKRTFEPSNGSRIHTILTFHKVQSRFSFSSTNFSPVRFERLLRFLLSRGFRFVPMEQAILEEEPTKLAITFDDGYAHLAELLPKLIDRYGLKPTVFMPTAFIGQNNNWDYSSIFQKTRHLDASSIRELADIGVTFGSHGHNHSNLTGCSSRKLTDELERSKNILEDILGTSVTSISYPFGRVNEAVQLEAQRVGYQTGVTMSFPSLNDRPMAIGRLPIYGFDNWLSIQQKIERGPLFRIEKCKCRITNRLSTGNSWWHQISGR